MKIEWFIANVAAVGSPTREERVDETNPILPGIFCSGIIWKVILKKEVNNEFYKNRRSKVGFSLPRAFLAVVSELL